MLPILRILPVGGVFLAILLTVLALKTPGERPLPPSMIVARGPLIDLNDHPEWRRVMVEAALRRADELMRLRQIPDTPAPVAPVVEQAPAPAPTAKIEPAATTETPASDAPIEIPAQAATPLLEQLPAATAEAAKVAGLPTSRSEADPDADSITGSIDDTPGATIPVEIGEASSFELPVVVPMPEERPPILRTPERTKPPRESRRKRTTRIARAKAQPPKPQAGLFDELFSGFSSQQASGGVFSNEAAPRTGAY